MTLKDLGDFLIYIGAVAAALAAVGVLIRFVVLKPLVNYLKEQIQPPLNKVHDEVNHNHGHSMKDQITSIDKTLSLYTEKFDEHLKNHP